MHALEAVSLLAVAVLSSLTPAGAQRPAIGPRAHVALQAVPLALAPGPLQPDHAMRESGQRGAQFANVFSSMGFSPLATTDTAFLPTLTAVASVSG